MPDPRETYDEFPFPLAGLDVSTGFDTPNPLTTQAGVNVRTFDPLTLRARGGSRPGIAKYVAGQVNGSHLIQSLGTITTANADALLDGADLPAGEDGIDDPSDGARNPGRTVRRGGSGRQPNRNTGNKKKQIQFIQASNSHVVVGSTDPSTLPGTSTVMTLPADVKAGDTIIVCASASVHPTDTQVNSYVEAVGGLGPTIYRASVISDGPCVISVAPAAVAQVLVFRGMKTGDPLGGTSTNLGTAINLTTGSVPVLASGEMLLGAFLVVVDNTTTSFDHFSAGSGFTLADYFGFFADPSNNSTIWLMAEFALGLSQDQAATASLSAVANVDPLTPIPLAYTASGASFEKQ